MVRNSSMTYMKTMDRKTQTSYDITYLWNLKKRYKGTYIQNTKIDPQAEKANFLKGESEEGQTRRLD